MNLTVLKEQTCLTLLPGVRTMVPDIDELDWSTGMSELPEAVLNQSESHSCPNEQHVGLQSLPFTAGPRLSDQKVQI